MPRASKTELENAAYETAMDLGKPPKPVERKFIVSWAEQTDLSSAWSQDVEATDLPLSIPASINQQAIEMEIKRTTKEALHKIGPLTMEDRYQVFFPSTSANYINNRAQAGSVGFILAHKELMKGLRRPGGYTNLVHPKEYGEEVKSKGLVYPEYSDNTADLQLAFSALWLRLLDEAKTEKPYAVPIGLPEALKNRVITKMPPAQQTVLRCIWKKLHNHLRRHPTFRLIGTPITEELINDMIGKLEQDEVFLSADYRSATNEIKSWASEACADEIASVLDLMPEEARLFKQSLTQHILTGQLPKDYMSKSAFKDDAYEILQKNGQLMGSITSFVVLCLINAAVSRWAYELTYKKVVRLRECPMGINGDDMAQRTKLVGYRYWREISSAVGLSESVGKTFISRKFVQINSMNYLYDEEGLCSRCDQDYNVRSLPFRYREVKYINMGLVTGQKRSGLASLNDFNDPNTTIGSRYREMLRLSDRAMWSDAHRQFIAYNKDVLSHYSIPWHMPEWIGGLGLTGFKSPNEKDLRMATRILQRWKIERPRALGESDIAWETWKIAETYLPEPQFTEDLKDPGISERAKQMGNACVNLLFDSTYKLEQIFKGPQIEAERLKQAINLCKRCHPKRWTERTDMPCKRCQREINSRKTRAILKHNQRIWKLPGVAGLPPALDESRLPFRRKYETTTIAPVIETDFCVFEDHFSSPKGSCT